MIQPIVRKMQPGDVQAIVKINASDVEGWVDANEGTGTFSHAYLTLSSAEQFMQGGPGMSVETCAVWINNLLTTQEAFPLVAEIDGYVVALASMFIGNEPSIFGRNAHLSELFVHRDYRSRGAGSALMEKCLHLATELRCNTFSVSPEDDAIAFYTRYHLKNTYPQKRLCVDVPRECRNIKFKEHWNLPYAASSIPMRIGRLQSSVQMWNQAVWPPYAVDGAGKSYPILTVDLKYPVYMTALQVFNRPETAYVFAWADKNIELPELVEMSFSMCVIRNFKKAILVIPENEAHNLVETYGGDCAGNHDLWVKTLEPV